MLHNLFAKYYAPDEIGGIETQTPAVEGTDEAIEPETKSFTQEELNRIIVREKEKATKAALKSLGFEDSSTAKTKIAELLELENNSKSDLEKLVKGKEKAEKNLTETTAKVNELETQLSLLKLGVTPEKISEANALIALKISEEKTMDEAVEELKIDFPMLFVGASDQETSTHSGTGSSNNPPRNPRQMTTFEGIGQRLAEQQLKQSGYIDKE